MFRIRFTDPDPEMLHIRRNVRDARRVGRPLAAHDLDVRPHRTAILQCDGLPVALMETWQPGERFNALSVGMAKVLCQGLMVGERWRASKAIHAWPWTFTLPTPRDACMSVPVSALSLRRPMPPSSGRLAYRATQQW